MSRKIKLFILISVLLNVLLLGIIIGHVSHRWGMGYWPRQEFSEKLQVLPKDKQDLLKQAMKQAFKEGKKLRKEIRQEREKVVDIFMTEPFDKAAYEAHVEAIHNLRGQQVRFLSDAIKQLATQFTPEERSVLVEVLRRPPSPVHGRRCPPYAMDYDKPRPE